MSKLTAHCRVPGEAGRIGFGCEGCLFGVDAAA